MRAVCLTQIVSVFLSLAVVAARAGETQDNAAAAKAPTAIDWGRVGLKVSAELRKRDLFDLNACVAAALKKLGGEAAAQNPGKSGPDGVGAAPDLSIRQRLQRAIDVSRTLADKGLEIKDSLGLQACEVSDRDKPWLFPRTEDVAAYERERPWSSKYAPNRASRRGVPANSGNVEDWPAPADAPELRKLLEDKDPAMRCVAAEALATLHQPEDVERIGRLLSDEADALPALGWNMLLTARMVQDQEIVADGFHRLRSWHDRTVATTARLALRLMTGADLSAQSFDTWWQRNSGGRNCVWYWQQRLTRELAAAEALTRAAFQDKALTDIKDYQARESRIRSEERQRFDAVVLLPQISECELDPVEPRPVPHQPGKNRLKEVFSVIQPRDQRENPLPRTRGA